MEQQNNKSNTLIYLGIAAGILIVLLIAYLAWSSSSDKKEEYSNSKDKKEEHSSSKDKTVQQKSTTTAIKGRTQAALYQPTLEKEQKKIKKDFNSMVVYDLNWSSIVQNYLYHKAVAALLIHLGIGYCFQVRNNQKLPWPWYCLYIAIEGNFEMWGGTNIPNWIFCTFWQIAISLSFFVVFSGMLESYSKVDLPLKAIKAKSGTQQVNLKAEAKGAQSQAFLTQTRAAKESFKATLKAREAAFKKEEGALNKKLDAIPSVEELEKVINAAQQARNKAENEEDANEIKKQEATLAALEQELAYANAVAANNKVKEDNKAIEKQKKVAARKLAEAQNRLKTPEYKAAAAAFEAHKAHADFLQDVIDIMDTLINKAKKRKLVQKKK